MVVNLKGVENEKAKTYIRKEGHYSLKCVEVRFLRNSENNNPIFRFTFKNKVEEYFTDDITITENTKWKIKQLSSAFGFEYDNVNIMHFKDMYLVAWITPKKVRNKVGETVEIFECKQYSKSAKLVNAIPPEHTQYVDESTYTDSNASIPEIDFNSIITPDDEIPF